MNYTNKYNDSECQNPSNVKSVSLETDDLQIEHDDWQPPPNDVIPVVLSGLKDADYTLEEDELEF